MSLKRLPDSPFVGYLARKNEIAVVEGEEELVCKSIAGVIALKQVIALLCGSALTAALWYSFSHPATASMPWLVTALVVTLASACWLAFFRNLLGTPCFTVNKASGDILLFRRRTREPWRKIPASEISHFKVEKQFYIDEDQQMENAVLLVFTTAGARRALCGSPDQMLIRSLAKRLLDYTRKPLDESLAE